MSSYRFKGNWAGTGLHPKGDKMTDLREGIAKNLPRWIAQCGVPASSLVGRKAEWITEQLCQFLKDNKLSDRKIICLCGSTRFTEEMLVKQWELTKQGYIVLSWCALPDSYFKGEDTTHHIGESTYNEISYAWRLGKPIDFSPPDPVLRENWNVKGKLP